MKIVFSTKNVSRASFLDTCRYAFDYGFEGFEIYDAIKERSTHHDSILRRDRIADAKRKLVNRNLAVSALRMPERIENEKFYRKKIICPGRFGCRLGFGDVGKSQRCQS